MGVELRNIEKMAQEADKLSRFRSLKISYIRDEITQILSFIGTNGIFDQYTKHDITHINAMLDLAYVIVPESTREIMTSAEWLLLTLAIYFHDMGMVVSREEYEKRETSDFPIYKQNVEEGLYGKDFIAKVRTLKDPDRFLYQEFVREHHAERIEQWIKGNKTTSWGSCDEVYIEIQRLFSEFDDLFRNDLALVCLSHHKDDLSNTDTYKLDEMLDESPNSKVNIQYIAIILRTADLMQITSSRTPSIAYHIINPNDPKSVLEWEKQAAVRSIVPEFSPCEVEEKREKRERDTFSIRAFFSRNNPPEAYFGLIAYLKYARAQIVADGKIILASESKNGAQGYKFPWKYIDDTKIVTEGFEKKQLQFTLDQNAILKLLIGHTLYNDSSVVLRELVQNSVDAIKYQNLEEGKEKKKLTDGLIGVNWNSSDRVLTVSDNGSGMTMDEVENYLLKVGASKYRSDDFLRENPTFNAIGRFGIGILTCFMVADDIDILTSSSNEKEAILLSIRNLHGKYLVKRISKTNKEYDIPEHGTSVILYLHEDVNMTNIEMDLKHWVVYPPYKVSLSVNDKTSISIGYKTPKDALESFFLDRFENSTVFEETIDGVTVAFSTTYNKYFKDYSFRFIRGERGSDKEDKKDNPVGICIEGIRVSDNPPGFESKGLIASCNIKAANYANTNVARSMLEASANKKELLRVIYQVYANHIEAQFKEKREEIGLAKAVEDCKALLTNFLKEDSYNNKSIKFEDEEIFNQVFSQLEQIIIETDGQRRVVSAASVAALDNIVIFQSRVLYSADVVLAEARNYISYSQLMRFLGILSFDSIKKEDVLFCNFDRKYFLHKLALLQKEINIIETDRENHNAIIRFAQNDNRWLRLLSTSSYSGGEGWSSWYFPKKDVTFTGLAKECFVVTWFGNYFVPDNVVTTFLMNIINHFDLNSKIDYWRCSAIVESVISLLSISMRANTQITEEWIEENLAASRFTFTERDISADKIFSCCDKQELITLLSSKVYESFNPDRWTRD